MYQDDVKNLTPEERERKKHMLKLEMTILDSETSRLMNEKNLLDAQIKNLKMDQERLRIEFEEKQKRLAQIAMQISQNDEDMKRNRKKLIAF